MTGLGKFSEIFIVFLHLGFFSKKKINYYCIIIN
jgi:hypothetical protein